MKIYWNAEKVFQFIYTGVMDKAINKVKKDVKKAEKDTNALLKLDKSFDKKLKKKGLIAKKK